MASGGERKPVDLNSSSECEVRGRHAKLDRGSSPRHAKQSSARFVIPISCKAVIAAASAVFAIGVGAFLLPSASPVVVDGGVAYGETPQQIEFDQRDVDGNVSDAELLRYATVKSDGASLDGGAAYAIVDSQATFTDSVGVIMQDEVMRGGCEVVSLVVVLDSMGIDVSADEIAEDYLVQDGSFATGYVGSPYTTGGGFPPGLVKAANLCLEVHNSSLRAHDLTGTPFEGLESIVNDGYPVMVWSTLYLDEPMWADIYEGTLQWYDNEHCVVVYGVNDDTILVSDPIDGMVERDRAEFERIYNACGCMALAIY